MVAVVQLVEHQVVILGVAGSSPVSHPKVFRRGVLCISPLGLNVKLGSERRVVGGFCCLGDGSFSYSDVVAVAGWDSVVIESWWFCFWLALFSIGLVKTGTFAS